MVKRKVVIWNSEGDPSLSMRNLLYETKHSRFGSEAQAQVLNSVRAAGLLSLKPEGNFHVRAKLHPDFPLNFRFSGRPLYFVREDHADAYRAEGIVRNATNLEVVKNGDFVVDDPGVEDWNVIRVKYLHPAMGCCGDLVAQLLDRELIQDRVLGWRVGIKKARSFDAYGFRGRSEDECYRFSSENIAQRFKQGFPERIRDKLVVQGSD